MLDDSWDSASSPEAKKRTTSAFGKNQKPSAKSSKYDFPSPTSAKRSSALDESKEFDPDILFSPTNSQGSPAGTPGDYKNRSYNFEDSPKKGTTDYLSNFKLESNELDDSILGELLGGGKKNPPVAATRPSAPRQRSPQPKLDPIDTSDASSTVRTRTPRRNNSPPKSIKASTFNVGPGDGGDFDADDDDFPISPAFGVKRQNSAEPSAQPSVSFKAPVGSSFDAPLLPVPGRGKARQAQPSLDVTHDSSFLDELNKSDDWSPLNTNTTAASASAGASASSSTSAPAIKRFTDGLVRPTTSHGLTAEPLPPAPQAAKVTNTTPRENSTPRDRADSGAADKDEDTAGLAFIPSFMEPGRQNRRRRQLDTSPGKGFGESEGGSGPSSIPKLNDLDIALGLGGTTSVQKKAVVDPFSAVDKKMPQLEKQASAAFQLDSDDSSSDDALLNRNRYNRKDTFTFNKPVPPGTATTTTTAPAAKTAGKEASQGFSGATAFPPAAATGSVATAPARVSTFTPAKPGAAAAVDNPAPVLASLGSHNADPPAPAAAASGPPTAPVRMGSHLGGTAPGPAHGMKMSDSFEDASPVKSPTSPTAATHGVASLPALPHISPVSSFRGASNAASTPGGANKKNSARDEVAKKEDSDVDDLDISGIVKINIDEDLTFGRRTTHKSPSHAAGRPKTARSPRASFASDNPPHASTTSVGSAGSSRPGTAAAAADTGAVPASVRTNSPAGVLTSAVNAYDQEVSQSRRNSATNLSASAVHSAPSYMTSLYPEVGTRDRAPSHAGPTGNVFNLPIDPPISSFGARKGTREDLPSMMDEPGDDVKTFTATDFSGRPPTAPVPMVPAEQLMQQLHVNKAELESKLIKEIEELKVKLMHPQPASFRTAQLEASAEEREHYRVLQDSNIKYVQEVIDQKRLIAHLESEISRLKDEAIIKARHTQEEMLHIKEKYEAEIKEIKIKNSIDTEALERRQEDALASLKKLHAHEIEAIKERYKSEEKFDLIAGQLRATSGSIQFIEQALQARQRGVEAMREGQIDARERLLQEMEEKARERAEIAEAEGYRLKGILAHMEHVVSNLRDQGSEEKERLRQEHSRLQARQTAFEAERNAQQARNLEELAYIKQRSKEVELELTRLTQEKQMAYEAISAAQHKLDTERTDFDAYVAATKRALEATENRLRDEEQRIARLRNEMLLEKTALDERRLIAMKDIEGAEELKNVLVRARQENESEKAELRRISQQYKEASEEILQQQAAIQEQQESLQERELALREGFAQMKLAASELSQREAAIRESTQMLERKRQAVERADRESLEHRLVSAASFREWSMRPGSEMVPFVPSSRAANAGVRGSWERYAGNGGDHVGGDQPAPTVEEMFDRYDFARDAAVGAGTAAGAGRTGPVRMTKSAEFDAGFAFDRSGFPQPRQSAWKPPVSAGGRAVNSSWSAEKENLYAHILAKQEAEKPWIEAFQEKLKQSFHTGTGGSGGAGGQAGGAGHVSSGGDRLPPELRSAQAALRNSRAQLARVTSSTINTQRLLSEETDFLTALQAKRQAAATT